MKIEKKIEQSNASLSMKQKFIVVLFIPRLFSWEHNFFFSLFPVVQHETAVKTTLFFCKFCFAASRTPEAVSQKMHSSKASHKSD